MNYFSHFVFDHKLLDHEFNTGLLLPDITRKSIKKFYSPESTDEFLSHHRSFLDGCLQHYETDKKFHGSTFFSKYYELLNHEISHLSDLIEVERKWFISHIVLELLIDRVIVNFQEDLLDSFYYSLEHIDENSLKTFLKFYGMKDSDEFFVFFNHFRNAQYIYHYTDNNKFMYSLNRIMMRANVKVLSQSDNETILEKILHFEKEHFNNPVRMINEIRETLK